MAQPAAKRSSRGAGNTTDKAANGGDGSRRDRIVELAAELFAEKGVGATTVRDIGNAAGILSGSLYYHFDSKESIVKEIVRDYLLRLIDSYQAVIEAHAEPRARLEGLIRASYEAIDRDRHACEIFQNDFKTLQALQDFDELQQLTSRFQKIWTDTIKGGVASGAFREDIDPKLFYRLARDAIWFTVRWYHPGGPDTVARLSRTTIAVLLDGFATPAR